MSRSLILPAVSLLMIGVATYHLVRTSRTPPSLDPPARPPRAPYGDTIAGSGLIEPCTENITLGTYAAGVVQEVCVKIGEHVDAGAPLFRIDEDALPAGVQTLVAFATAFGAGAIGG